MKLILVSFILSILSLVTAHNQLLYPYRRSCFYEDMRKGDQLAVSFQVGDRDPSSSNQLEVDFWITDPHKNQIQSLHRVADGDASVEVTESGRYEYCFSNEFSNVGTKDVTFHIHGIVYLDNENPSPDSLDSQVKILGRLVQEVKNEQGYLVIRERTHRNTAESTNARVKWWSLFQIIVVAVNSLFQIYYLKRFFEVKTNV